MKKRLLLSRIGWSATALGAASAVFLATRATSKPPSPAYVAAPAPATQTDERSRELERLLLVGRQNPKNPELAVEVGGLAGDLNQYEMALEWFQKAEKLNPRLLAALTGQGQMWMALGRPGLAAQKYEAALKLAPSEPPLLIELSRAYTALRVFDLALQNAEKAEKLAPSDPQVYRALAMIHSELANYPLARQVANRASELAPQDPENWVLLGDIWLREAHYREAKQALARALSLAPTHVNGNILYARLLTEGEKTPRAEREAFSVLARARITEPKNPQVLLMQAQILTRAGQLPLAISLLRQAREAAPRDSSVLLALGQALVRTGKAQEGIRLTTQGQKLGPRGVAFLDLEDLAAKNTDPNLALRLSDLYLRQERYDSAVYVLERGIRRTPGSQELRAKLATVRATVDRRLGSRSRLNDARGA